jgi:ubiquinone biosynthesis protein
MTRKYLPSRPPPQKISLWRRLPLLISRATRLLLALRVLLFRLIALSARSSTRAASELKARALREFLQSMGGIYIKLGQLMALRVDLFSWEFCQELSALHDKVAPFPTQQAIAIIERELAQPLGVLFSEFEPEPVAAASLGQVYAARLNPRGIKVAVKVRRPNIEVQVAADLLLLQGMAWLIDFFKGDHRSSAGQFIEEIRGIMEEELSYLFEARAGADFRRTLRGRSKVSAPRIFFDYVTDKLLVMEFVQGIPLRDILRAVQTEHMEELAALRAQGIVPTKLATRIYKEYLRQVTDFDIIHADPHPGNLIIQPDGHIAFIDFGAVAYFGPKFRDIMTRQAIAYANGDIDEMALTHLEAAEPLPAGNVDEYLRQFKRLLSRRMAESNSKYTHPADRSGARYKAEAARLSRIYGIPPSWEIMRLWRINLITTSVTTALDPLFDFPRRTRRFYKAHARRQRQQEEMSPADIQDLQHRYLKLAQSLPDGIESIVHKTQKILQRSELLFQRVMPPANQFLKGLLRHMQLACLGAAAYLVGVRIFKGTTRLDEMLGWQPPEWLQLPWWLVALVLLYVSELSRRFSFALNRFRRPS